jgi:hypothetical protein
MVHRREGFVRALCKEKINEFTWGPWHRDAPSCWLCASHVSVPGKRRVMQTWTSHEGVVSMRLGLSSVVSSDEGKVCGGELSWPDLRVSPETGQEGTPNIFTKATMQMSNNLLSRSDYSARKQFSIQFITDVTKSCNCILTQTRSHDVMFMFLISIYLF